MPSVKLDNIPTEEIPGLRITGNLATGSVDALAVINHFPPVFLPSAPAPTTKVPLFAYQEDGIKRLHRILISHGGALLADDMGLGKTRQAITVSKMSTGPVLIVCPASVRHQWQYEAKLQNINLANLGPHSKGEYEADWRRWQSSGGYAAVSYNMMGKALDVRRPTMLILDEPHNFLQGRGSVYNKQLWECKDLIRYKLALTGTPYLASPSGLWSILHILFGMRFGRAREFDIRYCNGHQGQWGWNNKGATHTEELAQRLKFYMIRRMKADVLKELPPVTRTVRWVDGTPASKQALLNIGRTANSHIEAEMCTLGDKIEETVDAVKSIGRPTVIFTWTREHCDKLAAQLKNAVSVHGGHEAGERARLVERANDSRWHVVTTYGASSTGLDGLQHFSSDLVFHSINPVPAVILQAIDRLNRIGQKEPITATFIAMKDSVNEITVDKVINRLDTWSAVLGKDKAAVKLSEALSLQADSTDMDDIFNLITRA